MSLSIIFIVIFIAIVVFWMFMLFFYSKKTWIWEEKAKSFEKTMNKIMMDKRSHKEEILDFDKLYHHILKEAWYEWSFWEILKKEPIVIDDLNLVWKLHKLRNKLAHDFDHIDEWTLRKNALLYKSEIQKLLQNVK